MNFRDLQNDMNIAIIYDIFTIYFITLNTTRYSKLHQENLINQVIQWQIQVLKIDLI